MSRTCRRVLLDNALYKNIALIKGRVLDIGGVRKSKRGKFVPPLQAVQLWQYANINPQTQPDFCCDAACIPAADGSYDTIVMTELLEYVVDAQAVLTEAYRLLSPGGICLVSVPFMNPIHGDNHADRQRFTELKLRELCGLAGFNSVSIEPMGAIFSVIYDSLYVSFGYAGAGPDKTVWKTARKFLELFKPLCLWLDGKSRRIRNYINTGYFIVLRKN